MSDIDSIRQRLHDLVRFAPEGETLRLSPSGRETTWTIDCMPLTFGDPVSVGFEIANALTDAGVNQESFDAIGGPDLSGVPMALSAGMTGGHRAFAVRRAAVGVPSLSGDVEAGDRVVLVDDVYTTGRTLHGAVAQCTREGLVVVAALVLVYRGNVSEQFKPPDKMAMPVLGDKPEDQAATIPFIAMFLPTDLGVEPGEAYVLEGDDAEA